MDWDYLVRNTDYGRDNDVNIKPNIFPEFCTTVITQ